MSVTSDLSADIGSSARLQCRFVFLLKEDLLSKENYEPYLPYHCYYNYYDVFRGRTTAGYSLIARQRGT